jgi:hypothetical protein
MKTLFKWLTIILVFTSVMEVNAKTIGLRVLNTSGVEGTYVNVPVNADTSFTGENVIAFDITFTYNTTIFTLDTIVTTGSLTSGWTSFALDRSVSGKIRVIAVNATPLSGTGVLFYLRFYAKSYGNSTVGFEAASTILNEGSPKTKLTNGTVTITAKPKITVSPNSGIITAGDKLQFYVSGGTSPYTWSVTNPSVSSISSTGLLTSTAKGFTRVVAVDNAGIRDTSDLSVEIRGLKLYFRDTSIFEAHTLLLPLYTTNLSVLNINSGKITVSFNSNYLKAKSIVKTGSILNSVSNIQFNSVEGSGECTFTFAGTTGLTGSGVLCYIEFDAISGGYNTLNVTDALFNEDILANKQTGSVQVKTLPVLNISPVISSIQVGKTQKFTASNGTAPYTWSTSDATLASIASDGTFTALKSGMVKVLVEDVYGAKGSSGFINLVAAQLSIHDSVVYKNITLKIPVWLENYVNGNDLYSYQFDIEFDTTKVTFLGFENTGSLSAGWSVAGNRVGNAYKIAAASTQSVHTAGALLYLQVQLKSTMTQWQSTLLSISNIVLNEGLPLATFHNGSLQNQSPVKIETLTGQDNYRIFPNPNNGEFTFLNNQEKNLIIEIVNLQGKVVTNYPVITTGINPVKLNIPAGTYILFVKDTNSVLESKKIIIIK